MCKEYKCVQSFVHFLAVIIFITYTIPILSPGVGVSLTQNALFSIDIPTYTTSDGEVMQVVSLIGLHQIDTGVHIPSRQWADLEDIHCTDDWIPCRELHSLHVFLYGAVGLSLLSIIFSCCHQYKCFGLTSFVLIICVTGTVLVSTKMTADVAHKIHNESDALSFVCETSGLDSGVMCVIDFAKMVYHQTDSNRRVPQPSGMKFELDESGVSIYVSEILIALCASSAFVVISGAVLFIWFFLRALCCCCCSCCFKDNEHGEYQNFNEGEGSINRV